MRFPFSLLVLLASLCRLSAQDNQPAHSLFGCSEEAVEVATNRQPPLRFVSLAHPPGDITHGKSLHHFVFYDAGPFEVNVYLSAIVGESAVGRGSAATLKIYVETSRANDSSGRNHWWKVEAVEADNAGPDHASSESLRFDAPRIGGCFRQETDCSFAKVALATPDANVPLLVIKFGEDLGGANANNWTEASLLLDFRSSSPRVLATADCAYNEGGGACTAIDSEEMERSGLSCDWVAASEDFLCSETSSPAGVGHRDFFLLSDQPAPLRPGEVSSLQEAVGEFRSKGTAAPVKVQGIGPVVWIDELKTSTREKVLVLGAPDAFYVIPQVANALGTPVLVEAHPILGSSGQNQPARPDGRAWTLEQETVFHSQVIYDGRDLTVLQIVATELPNSRQLYWFGIPKQSTTNSFDAVQLVGGWRYGSCGESLRPENVVSVGRISRPFSAPVRLQPSVSSRESDSSLTWVNTEEDQPTTNCIRRGRIVWQGGKFQGSMENAECRAAENPKYVGVDGNGKITLTDKLTE